ncbi:MAG: hypothetical protein HUJ29_00405 [Gammaproteobacteria bacterium]|nr:hypothetical protein [Gammaproteobacteria bacterium]
MIRLIITLWTICTLRYGPQVLPGTRNTLYWVLGLHLVIGTLYNLVFADVLYALQMELAALLISYVFVRVALLLGNRNERFNQTLTALLGSDVIISAVGLLLVNVLMLGLGLEALWTSTSLLLMAWSFIVAAHIFRHSFSTHFAVGSLIAFMFFFTSLVFVVLLQSSMSSQ